MTEQNESQKTYEVVAVGRPPIDLKDKTISLGDPQTVEDLAYMGASLRIMAELFGMAYVTLQKRYNEDKDNKLFDPAFRTAYERGRARRKMDIHRWQMNAAMRGNPAMLIFLGKNELGQADKKEVKQTTETKIDVDAVLQQIQAHKANQAAIQTSQRVVIEEKTTTHGSDEDKDSDDDTVIDVVGE